METKEPSVIPNHDNIKKAIADRLGVEVSDDWGIIDFKIEQGLYLVHYGDDIGDDIVDNKKRLKFGHLRGIVLNVTEKPDGTLKCIVVNKAFGYIPRVEMDELPVGTAELVDNMGQKHKLDHNIAILKPGHEGITIRPFYFGGRVYYSSHRKIDIFDSNVGWYTSIPFRVMYDTFKAPKGEELYDMSKKYSPWVHIIILVHKSLYNVSKEDLKEFPGYPIYIGSRKMWENEFNIDETDNDMRMPPNLTHDIEEARRDGKLYTPPNLTLEQANTFLKYGWHGVPKYKTDPKKLPGEFIIGYLEGASSKTIVKIQSGAYPWRSNIKGNEPNCYHRFCELMQYKNRFDEKMFLKYHKYTVESMTEHFKTFAVVVYAESDFKPNVTDNAYNIWISYLMSVPLHKQKEVAEYYVKYCSQLDALSKFLYLLYKKGDYLGKTPSGTIEDRAYKIVNLANDHWIRQDKGAKSRKPKDLCIAENIAFLLNNEKGANLYNLFSYINKQ